MPFCLQRSCPAHLGLPGRQKRPQDLHVFTLGLHFPPRLAVSPHPCSFGTKVPDPRANLFILSRKPRLTEMTQHHPQNAPASPLTVTLRNEKRGEKSCDSQPRADQPPEAPGRPLPPEAPRAPRPADASPGSEEGARAAGAPSPPALTLAGAGVSPRRSRAVTGAAGVARRLRAERGGASPRRGRLRGAGWQAGARHGFCPIQHFPILSPFSFERESPAQISEPPPPPPPRGAQELTSPAPGV